MCTQSRLRTPLCHGCATPSTSLNPYVPTSPPSSFLRLRLPLFAQPPTVQKWKLSFNSGGIGTFLHTFNQSIAGARARGSLPQTVTAEAEAVPMADASYMASYETHVLLDKSRFYPPRLVLLTPFLNFSGGGGGTSSDV